MEDIPKEPVDSKDIVEMRAKIFKAKEILKDVEKLLDFYYSRIKIKEHIQ